MIALPIVTAAVVGIIVFMTGRGLWTIAMIDKRQDGEHWRRHEKIAYAVALGGPVPAAGLTFALTWLAMP